MFKINFIVNSEHISHLVIVFLLLKQVNAGKLCKHREIKALKRFS